MLKKNNRKAFNIELVWNPACCNTINNLIKQSFGNKESNISDTNWFRYLAVIYLVEYMTS